MSLGKLLQRPVLEVAPRLLGMRLVSELGGHLTAVMLSEVEAYDGAGDPASHAYGGRTRRNESMFGPAGTAYVYRSYGIHWCLNVVVGPAGEPGAVLLRGGIPITGRESMVARRRRHDHLSDGPGKLCQALGVTGEDDGRSLLAGPLRLEGAGGDAAGQVAATPRIGITKATERPWRFVLLPTPG